MESRSADSISPGPVALVSTTRVVVDPLHRTAVRSSPETSFLHFVDEGILAEKARTGKITPGIIDWLKELLERAARSGASRAIVTCSSLSPAVNPAAAGIGIPVTAIDYPLYRDVLLSSEHPAVLMTNPTTLEPSQAMIRRIRSEFPEAAEAHIRLLDDAFKALSAGNPDGHDTAVASAIEELAVDHDAVILAQISITRVRDRLPEKINKLTRSSLDYIGDIITGKFD